MLFWKDVGNGILLDRPFPFKLHQSYDRYCVVLGNLIPRRQKSGRDNRRNADLYSCDAAERGIISSRTKVKVLRVFCSAFEASTQFNLQRSIRPH